jgi:hypothetical protein
MRRKGERPVIKLLDSWSPDHPVARAMATGSTWYQAWAEQKGTPLTKLVRRTGILPARLLAIDQGDRISRAEIDALAIAWSVSSEDLIASLSDPGRVVS